MNVLVFGSQGSGKSTHGKYIAQKLNLPYISTGELFRKIAAEVNSQLGKKVQDFLSLGKLIPDDLTYEVLDSYLKTVYKEAGFVLDGFPRNLHQVNHLQERIDLIFIIKVSEKEAVKRLLARGRSDDSENSIRGRIRLYKEQTLPVLNYYKNKGIRVIEVDNTPSVEEVQKKLDDYLKK